MCKYIYTYIGSGTFVVGEYGRTKDIPWTFLWTYCVLIGGSTRAGYNSIFNNNCNKFVLILFTHDGGRYERHGKLCILPQKEMYPYTIRISFVTTYSVIELQLRTV